MRRLAAVALALVLAAACSAGQLSPLSILKPSVRLHHLGIRNVGLAGGTLDLVLAFHNPNRIALKGTRLHAGLDIETTHFGDVDLTDPFELTARDTSLVTVPLTFRWAGLGVAARSLLDYGAVNYQINGTASVDAPLGQVVEVPFSGRGNVPLLRSGSTR